MAAILDKILAATRARVAEAKRGADLRDLGTAGRYRMCRGVFGGRWS